MRKIFLRSPQILHKINSLCYAPNMNTTIINTDCMRILPEITDASVDMILCDPPYGTTRNAWDIPLPLEELWREWKRVLSPSGVVVVMGQGIFGARLLLTNEDGFSYRMTWVKSKATNFLNAKRQPLRRHEDIYVFCRKNAPYHPQMTEGKAYDKGVRKDQGTGSWGAFSPCRNSSAGGRYPTDVIYFPTAESEGKVTHPTQKPLALGRLLVRTYTDPGMTVLDCACGSGTFVLAAAVEGRRGIGIEKDPRYAALARERIDEWKNGKEKDCTKASEPPLFSSTSSVPGLRLT